MHPDREILPCALMRTASLVMEGQFHVQSERLLTLTLVCQTLPIHNFILLSRRLEMPGSFKNYYLTKLKTFLLQKILFLNNFSAFTNTCYLIINRNTSLQLCPTKLFTLLIDNSSTNLRVDEFPEAFE